MDKEKMERILISLKKIFKQKLREEILRQNSNNIGNEVPRAHARNRQKLSL